MQADRPYAEIEGFASLFDVTDGGGDTVRRGAFADSLRTRGPRGIRFLFQHDPSQPIGHWVRLEETSSGLFVRGRINMDVARGRELSALVSSGGLDGLSIGFRPVAALRAGGRARRLLTRIDLWEISLVTFPMLAGARVTRVRLPPPAPEPDRRAGPAMAGRAATTDRATRFLHALKQRGHP